MGVRVLQDTNRTIMITGFIHAGLTEEWKRMIEEMREQNPHQPISLYINSRGGEAESAFSFYRFLREVDEAGTPIIGIVIGNCKSAAAVILLACRHREAFANAAFLIHYPVMVIQADPEEVEKEMRTDPLFHMKMASVAADAILIMAEVQLVMLERTSMTAESIEILAVSERAFSAFEALRFGLIHRIC